MEQLATVQIYEKNEILKMCKGEEIKADNTAELILDKLSDVEIDSKKQEEIIKILEYEYKNKSATTLKNKMSVTEIKEKRASLSPNASIVGHARDASTVNTSPNASEVEMAPDCWFPKFLQTTEETVITSAQKGTLVHLCMQKLDLSKANYTYGDVKELVSELEAKKIITSKEAQAININKIYQFTKSQIWKEMIQAKDVQREKPFYINIPAKEIYNEDLEEKILVQGIIDLYYVTQDDEIVLVDFKTDFVEDRNEKYLIDKYKTQLDLYKRALESSTGQKVSRVYIYSTYLEKDIML